ncbi:GNAT family N-acetyltransferase [Secundilactobacillus malefermentans]|uniref:N-acetyltransferase domain-containing protein n=1 Tax=Secundilactobacillus malefermentans TaxID=176292 RepID=A0A4R5NM29_9LACO|nr:GNAT family N-acetyltransferase [Secundilactobacillus malefermentans]KRM57669.1 N-acetyltransferase GCN5 [Secundilactobacillus malefermentans DSM 5705 = KCTC 3548]QEA31257.1 GNAT family N-acetyltransferase [Secundilactobacillus malefermentans]TDG76630.1 hypothetical protein C5L31_000183 [Secundilactobacillus malefermentans]
MELIVGNQKWNRGAALFIRQSVFVTERGIAREDEFDAKDTDETIYVVAYEDASHPAATARYEKMDAETVRPGRVATLPAYRHQGLAAKVLNALEEFARKQGLTRSLIHGELDAVGFYEKMGYQVASAPFEEDGAPVVTLTKQL